MFTLGNRQYHFCSICPSLMDQVEPSVLYSVIEATRQLPITIQESAKCQPLRGYTVLFHPTAKLARVIVSIPPPQIGILTHLTSTIQLFHMGLTGDPEARGQTLDSFLSMKSELFHVQEQMAAHNINLEALSELKRVRPTLETQRDSKATFYRLVCGQDMIKKDITTILENKERDYRQQIQCAKDRVRSLKQSLSAMFPSHTKILGVPTSPGFSSWSVLSQPSKFLPPSNSASSSDCITEKADTFLNGPWTRRQLAHNQKSGAVSNFDHKISGNVCLDLSKDGAPDATTLHLSSPTLLRERYNKWISPIIPGSTPGKAAFFIVLSR